MILKLCRKGFQEHTTHPDISLLLLNSLRATYRACCMTSLREKVVTDTDSL